MRIRPRRPQRRTPGTPAGLYTAGVAQSCVGVLGTGLGVPEPADGERAAAAFLAAGRRSRDAGAETLVLGCAGMTGLERRVSAELGLPVVGGVGAAVRLAETLVALGLTSSRAGSYAKPLPEQRLWGPAKGREEPLAP